MDREVTRTFSKALPGPHPYLPRDLHKLERNISQTPIRKNAYKTFKIIHKQVHIPKQFRWILTSSATRGGLVARGARWRGPLRPRHNALTQGPDRRTRALTRGPDTRPRHTYSNMEYTLYISPDFLKWFRKSLH